MRCRLHAPLINKDKEKTFEALKTFVRSIPDGSILDLIGIKIAQEFDFSDLFPGSCSRPLLLMDAEFGAGVTAASFSFRSFLYATGARCAKQWVFDGVVFEDDADFGHAGMIQALIINCTFQAGAYFQVTDFSAGITFNGTRFEDRACFGWARFTGFSYFRNVFFGGETDFDGSSEPATPERSSFDCIDFSNSTFRSRCSFINREFRNSTDFEGTVFHVAPEFRGCKLHQATSFSGATFLDKRGGRSEVIEADHSVRLPDPASCFRTIKQGMLLHQTR